MRTIGFLFLLMLADGSPGFSGASNCRCAGTSPPENSAVCPDPARPVLVEIANKQYCYPNGYGSKSCRAWDANLQPFCADTLGNPLADRPHFCSQSWCYVDRKCELADKTMRIHSTALLYLSYSTCGHVASLNNSLHVSDILNGATLRVYLVDYPPYVFKDRTVTDARGRGILVDFLLELKYAAGFEIQEVDLNPPIPPEGVWDGCVNAVSAGTVDLCLGDYWLTSARFELSSWVTPFSWDFLYPVTKDSLSDATLFDSLVLPFKPFSWRLWGAIAAAIVVVGFMVYIFEFRTAGEPDSDFDHGSHCNNLSEAIYLSCIGFWNQGTANSPKVAGTKIVLLGFAFFIALAMASYTANLANYLVVKQVRSGAFSTIEKGLLKGDNFCMWPMANSPFISAFPEAEGLVRIVHSDEEGYASVENGDCVGYLAQEEAHDFYLKRKGNCNKVLIRSLGASLPNSFLIAPNYQRSLSFWITALNANYGMYELVFGKYVPLDACPRGGDDGNDSPQQMQVKDFHGVIVVVGVLGVLAIFVEIYLVLRSRKRRAQAVDTAPSLDVPAYNDHQQQEQRLEDSKLHAPAPQSMLPQLGLPESLCGNGEESQNIVQVDIQQLRQIVKSLQRIEDNLHTHRPTHE